MKKHILPGVPPVEIQLRKSPRARRLSLRISRLDGRVTLTMPTGFAVSEAVRFAIEKEAWLRSTLAARPADCDVGFGTSVAYLGKPVEIVPGSGRVATYKDGVLQVPGGAETVGRKVQAFLKARAKPQLHRATEHYAQKLGRSFSRITLRDTRSRWGSCSSAGNLNYSWRLIMAPPDVLNYVAAHEVAHLAEMNHSARFWSVVRDIHGPYDAQRGWLRHKGENLHRYRFGD
ncbi:M48 family metallopeptidase [Parasulfitobacter algicola]|uniref:M48 family metallopeptidase n=1 Tax=Parasulfitobacter algicola TaxID=2614809 RepID=A0ABX2INJ4_9RHOB|nr:SprT family zinc-dependent metalloprotease [Sulfitobacter algicola]NSX54120.1 M48 family metallopeptidase [Sulfitobacter algicola]